MYYSLIKTEGMWNVFGDGALLKQFTSEDKAQAFITGLTSKIKDSLKSEVLKEMTGEYKDSLRNEVQVENLKRIIEQMEYRLKMYNDDKAKAYDKVLDEFKSWLNQKEE